MKAAHLLFAATALSATFLLMGCDDQAADRPETPDVDTNVRAEDDATLEPDTDMNLEPEEDVTPGAGGGMDLGTDDEASLGAEDDMTPGADTDRFNAQPEPALSPETPAVQSREGSGSAETGPAPMPSPGGADGATGSGDDAPKGNDIEEEPTSTLPEGSQ